jgi:predicted O-methyltransferase YrrM
MAVEGWTDQQQLRHLMAEVRSLSDHSFAVEIGVWKGRSALAMADACRGTSKKVFAIDPWEDYTQGGMKVSSRLKEWGVDTFEDVYESFRSNVEKLGLEQWIVPVRLSSQQAAKTWSHGPISLIFIDGNHDFEALLLDLEVWFPVVRNHGLVCGDDWDWDTVKAAVLDFLARHPECRLTRPCSRTWAFEKICTA